MAEMEPDGDRGKRQIPVDLIPGRRTPDFTAESVPPALLGEHLTSRWARLEVSAGSVEFIEAASGWRARSEPDSPVVIVPHLLHRVKPSFDAVFAVQFFVPSSEESAD